MTNLSSHVLLKSIGWRFRSVSINEVIKIHSEHKFFLSVSSISERMSIITNVNYVHCYGTAVMSANYVVNNDVTIQYCRFCVCKFKVIYYRVVFGTNSGVNC